MIDSKPRSAPALLLPVNANPPVWFGDAVVLVPPPAPPPPPPAWWTVLDVVDGSVLPSWVIGTVVVGSWVVVVVDARVVEVAWKLVVVRGNVTVVVVVRGLSSWKLRVFVKSIVFKGFVELQAGPVPVNAGEKRTHEKTRRPFNIPPTTVPLIAILLGSTACEVKVMFAVENEPSAQSNRAAPAIERSAQVALGMWNVPEKWPDPPNLLQPNSRP